MNITEGAEVHTLSINEDSQIHYHGDFSGNVTIVSKVDGHTKIVHLPARGLLAFAAEFVRQKQISRIENADSIDLLLNGVDK